MSFSSSSYWEERYKAGRTSGAGSSGRLQRFKSNFVNSFVEMNEVSHVIDLGSGDGSFADQIEVTSYVGVDVARSTVEANRRRFSERENLRFIALDELPNEQRAELTLSLDVIYHLVEDDVFEQYMTDLFDWSSKYVIVYASNEEKLVSSEHVRHRKFTDVVARRFPAWRLAGLFPNVYPFEKSRPRITSFADFYVYSLEPTGISFHLPSVEAD